MIEFAVALGLFLAAHVVPTRPALRRRLAGTLGERVYLGLYSLLSILLLGWVIFAAIRAPYVELWPPAPWQAIVSLAMMPLSLALLGAAVVQPNPLSVATARGAFDTVRPGIVAVTRHPLLWGFALWGVAHLPPNGDVVSVVLFGAMTAFAGLGMWAVERRRRRELGPSRWAELAGATSVMPFAALANGRAGLPRDLRCWLGIAAGLGVYALLVLGGHVWLFGVDPLGRL
ncbi:MAG: NnrU family protein [Rhodospirillaceae bacterium]|nr:NnrU family protein [Rhodospirillaceae bacterium]